jgi:hypothetical protein
MCNGFDAGLVGVRGAKKLGTENVCDKMVARGVPLDVTKFKGVDPLDDGYAISIDDLNSVRRGTAGRMGELFCLKELAEDCGSDRIYESFFVARPLHLPRGGGSLINPRAIK